MAGKVKDAPKGKAVDTAAAAKEKAKEAAEQMKAEKEAKAKEKEKEKAEKEAAKTKEKEEAAAKRAEESEKRKALKAGPGKLLKSLIARIKYMRYMDNPSSALDGVENLTWELTLVNSEGTTYTVKRGETVDQIEVTIKEQGKKAITPVHGNADEDLDALIEQLKP